jgi:uncharacterized LabA/DUF88 family protein
MNGTEAQSGQRFVALFIDWDNLVISTSAEMGGASPDLPKIVQKAREYGTIVIAKAYAEWSVTSDRLNVYRAGIEPVYAPTFRFEPDPNAPGVRSKSLADPCMVTDCIETLHLLPMITDFVLVTGDKDLIPVVRLVQLRGKRVTVIGPDLVANVLREMADNFVPYRSLVSEGDPRFPAGPDRTNGRKERSSGEPIADSRRSGRSPQRQPEPPRSAEPARAPETPRQAEPTRVAEAPPPARPPVRERVESTYRPPVYRPPMQAPATATPAPATVEPAPAFVEPVVSTLLVAEPLVAPAEVEQPITLPAAAPLFIETAVSAETQAPALGGDLNAVFDAIISVIQSRMTEGRNRVRATAIRDAIIKQFPGFDENIYGFNRFKDLLEAMQKDGLINVIRIGPVQWASIAKRPETAPIASAAPVEPAVAPATLSPERLEDLVRFLVELRSRSRWLTNTHVLANLTTHLAQDMPAAAAEVAARDALNALVSQGILQVDTEPQEVDVHGKTHRLRMCRVVDSHPMVARVLASIQAESAVETPATPEEPAGPTDAQEPAQVEGEETPASPAAEAPAPSESEPMGMLARPAEVVALVADTNPVYAQQELEAPEEPRVVAVTETIIAEPGEPIIDIVEVDTVIEPSGDEAVETIVEEFFAIVEEQPRPSRTRRRGSRGGSRRTPSEDEQEIEAPAPTAPAAETEAVAEEPATSAEAPVASETPGPALDQEGAYQATVRLVQENINAERPRLRAPGLKQRLMRSLGHFDEHDYGFSRFSDFLQAAAQAGLLVVEKEGSAVWVSLPATDAAV